VSVKLFELLFELELLLEPVTLLPELRDDIGAIVDIGFLSLDVSNYVPVCFWSFFAVFYLLRSWSASSTGLGANVMPNVSTGNCGVSSSNNDEIVQNGEWIRFGLSTNCAQLAQDEKSHIGHFVLWD
tara:strand:- start:175 stop:555 length:381 start_codon:yes stop_codon:yes gene_type:complete